MSSNPVPVPVIPAADLRHRLRTPLNHIIGYSEMLLEDSPPETAAARLGAIAEAKSMLETIQLRLGRRAGYCESCDSVRLRSELAGRIEKSGASPGSFGLCWLLKRAPILPGLRQQHRNWRSFRHSSLLRLPRLRCAGAR